MFRFHFFSHHLFGPISFIEIGADIQINVIQIDIFNLFVNLPVRWAISDSEDQAYHLSYIPSNHNNQNDDIVSLHDVPIVLFFVYLTRIKHQEWKRGSEDAQ